MKTIIVLLSLLSLNAFADEYYKCYRVQEYRGSYDITMKLTTGLFSKKVVAADLITKIRGNFEAVASPYTDSSAEYYGIDQDTMNAAAGLNYKAIEKTASGADKSSYKITLSESLLNLEKTGYAHYYANQCFWILDCNQTSHFFKCDKL